MLDDVARAAEHMPVAAKYALLNDFLAMYSSRVGAVIQRYRAGGEPAILLADALVRVVPDMKLHTLERDDIARQLDTQAPAVRLMLRQFDTLDPKRECVIGLRFARDDVLTHVVRIRVQRAPEGK